MKKHLSSFASASLLLCSLALFSFVSDNDFMAKASQANLAEVAAAKLALTKSSSAQVKMFAKQMISDHTGAQKELVMLAKKKGVTIPMEPDADHKAMKEQLMGLSGAAFDSMYLNAQVTDHQAAVALFTDESANGTDADAKSFATKYLPKLKGHLGMIPGKSSGMGMNMEKDAAPMPGSMSMDSSKMTMDSTK